MPQIINNLKSYFLLFAILPFFYSTQAQKHPLNADDMSNWETVSDAKISNNGTFALYTINNRPINSHTLVIKKLIKNSKWAKEFIGIESSNAQFSKNSQYVLFKNKSDSLFIYSLADDTVTTINKISAYELINIQDKEYVLLNQKNNNLNDIYIFEIKKPIKEIHSFKGICNWHLNAGQSQLWLLSEDSILNNKHTSLILINLKNWETRKVQIAITSHIDNLIINPVTGSIAFIETSGLNKQLLNYYNPNEGICNAYDLSGNKIKRLIKISPQDDKIFFSIENREDKNHDSTQDTDGVKVDIWNYKDLILQSIQLKNPVIEKELVGAINLKNGKSLHLTKKGENIIISPNGEWAFCSLLNGDKNERHWNPLFEYKGFIVNTQNGERLNLKNEFSEAYFSPTSKYLICQDKWYCNWLCYDLNNKKLINITNSIPIPQQDSNYDRPALAKTRGLILVGWSNNDENIIFYDSYDIWSVDPKKIDSPICLTNGEGRKQGITFRLLNQDDLLLKKKSDHNTLILSAFNQSSKENGFYSLIIGPKNILKKISMSNCVYNYPGAPGNSPPIKAKNKLEYIVRHMSEIEAPNFFHTTDFKHFFPISNLTPQKNIVWYKNRVLSWNDPNGRTSQGILYLPENFDSTKQYPTIINIYEKKSQEVHYFRDPEFQGGSIDLALPWFIGRGFLIYTIDINYTIGNTGESALKAVERGVNELSKLPFIDTNRLGIQGHSFGGFEVNYIITHSNLFKAAMSAAGVADLISLNAQFSPGGQSHQTTNELAQIRMGGSLWDKPDSYINNSPLFNLDKVTTPVLIMANKLDVQVPYEQGVELFTSLRRLGKPAWLLQYNGEGHVLYNKNSVIDYLARMEQFFSHYLKSTPAPAWMKKEKL